MLSPYVSRAIAASCVCFLLAALGCSTLPASHSNVTPSAVTRAPNESITHAPPQPPSVLYGELYREVELSAIYPDSKTFADMQATAPPEQIVAAYHAERTQAGFHLSDFVERYFIPPPPLLQANDKYIRAPHQNLTAYIDSLWNVLSRGPDNKTNAHSSHLPLPYSYIAPGGRFNEIYYWDSYFIMLGLAQSGRFDLVTDEFNNFVVLINRYGHIPNGNRTYYLSRSQPPFFSQMLHLIAKQQGDAIYLKYLTQLEQEYAYWMHGADTLERGRATHHLVRLDDGTFMNRYWDHRAAPRDESYREDVMTARETPSREPADLWRNLRAGAETGWDFSSRWFADNRTLGSINVTSLIPIDLNALLVDLEHTLARAYQLQGDATRAEQLSLRAQTRAQAIRKLLWDPNLQAFCDYNFEQKTLTHRLTAATVYPLYLGIATREQAHAVATTLERQLLRPGGLATTQIHTNQQWDEPNGWAPLQYLAIAGLRRYGYPPLAQTIATRWIHTNAAYYRRTGKLVEKYDISTAASNTSASGGEYPLQDGFGWTNGVLRVLLALYPDALHIQHMPAAPAS